MPELPDLEDYLGAMQSRMVGATVRHVRIAGVSLLRSYDPPIDGLIGKRITGLRRLGKRLVWELDAGSERWFVIVHLMIAGRLRWSESAAKMPARIGLAAFEFSRPGQPDEIGGTLLLTEAGTRRRASLYVVASEEALREHDRGGIEPLETNLAGFREQLLIENRTLKRVLTDPRRFSGIGNAYSDEILHAARLSPLQLTANLSEEQISNLFTATQELLADWSTKLRAETGEGFPSKVTAFRDGFAVHGRFQAPCPVCGTAVQRIRYADNELNYCPRCQTGGALLADRSLSRLLKDDWPKSIDELEGWA